MILTGCSLSPSDQAKASITLDADKTGRTAISIDKRIDESAGAEAQPHGLLAKNLEGAWKQLWLLACASGNSLRYVPTKIANTV